MRKSVTLKTFNGLKNRPTPSRSGVTFVIENVDLPGTKHDGKIYKKYVKGKLVKQVFVTNAQHKNLLKKGIQKAKLTFTKKNKKGGIVKGSNNTPPNVVYVQGPPVAQQVEVKDTTGAGQIAKGALIQNGIFFAMLSIFDALKD